MESPQHPHPGRTPTHNYCSCVDVCLQDNESKVDLNLDVNFIVPLRPQSHQCTQQVPCIYL